MIRALRNLAGVFKNINTDAGGNDFEILRMAATSGAFAYIALAILNWRSFDPIAFGTGYSAVLLALGSALRIKEGAQPPPPPAQPTPPGRE